MDNPRHNLGPTWLHYVHAWPYEEKSSWCHLESKLNSFGKKANWSNSQGTSDNKLSSFMASSIEFQTDRPNLALNGPTLYVSGVGPQDLVAQARP
jgi:hypothetical protein